VFALLHRLVRHLPDPRVIYDRAGVSPYLSRWYLHEHRHGKGIAIFLHCFHRGDDDLELHNHPWTWSVALILAGGYREERRVGDDVIVRQLRPFSINVIRGTDFHRVDLYNNEAWSLFVAGPQTGLSWGFWNRLTRTFTPWREFINRKRGIGWKES
jgi:hypothetical protein